MAQGGAAVTIRDAELTGEGLARTVGELVARPRAAGADGGGRQGAGPPGRGGADRWRGARGRPPRAVAALTRVHFRAPSLAVARPPCRLGSGPHEARRPPVAPRRPARLLARRGPDRRADRRHSRRHRAAAHHPPAGEGPGRQRQGARAGGGDGLEAHAAQSGAYDATRADVLAAAPELDRAPAWTLDIADGSFELRLQSESGTWFTMTRRADGTLERGCDRPRRAAARPAAPGSPAARRDAVASRPPWTRP